MIIGISGKIGSGKDIVGKIICELTDVSYPAISTITKQNWQIKKFAFKVKQIASILTNIPVEDFEKEEVKNKILGEEWTRYGYADGFTHVYHNGNKETTIMNNKQCDKERYEIELKINWQTAYKHQYTVRELLQLIGTEAMRNVIHFDVWVNALMSEYNSNNIEQKPNWIITDVRFPNELEAIKNRQGITIRVNRDDYIFDNEGKRIIPSKSYVNTPIVQHSSETALDEAEFDYTIDNNGTIEELIEQVKQILTKEQII